MNAATPRLLPIAEAIGELAEMAISRAFSKSLMPAESP